MVARAALIRLIVATLMAAAVSRSNCNEAPGLADFDGLIGSWEGTRVTSAYLVIENATDALPVVSKAACATSDSDWTDDIADDANADVDGALAYPASLVIAAGTLNFTWEAPIAAVDGATIVPLEAYHYPDGLHATAQITTTSPNRTAHVTYSANEGSDAGSGCLTWHLSVNGSATTLVQVEVFDAYVSASGELRLDAGTCAAFDADPTTSCSSRSAGYDDGMAPGPAPSNGGEGSGGSGNKIPADYTEAFDYCISARGLVNEELYQCLSLTLTGVAGLLYDASLGDDGALRDEAAAVLQECASISVEVSANAVFDWSQFGPEAATCFSRLLDFWADEVAGDEADKLSRFCSDYAGDSCEICALCSVHLGSETCDQRELCSGWQPWWNYGDGGDDGYGGYGGDDNNNSDDPDNGLDNGGTDGGDDGDFSGGKIPADYASAIEYCVGATDFDGQDLYSCMSLLYYHFVGVLTSAAIEGNEAATETLTQVSEMCSEQLEGAAGGAGFDLSELEDGYRSCVRMLQTWWNDDVKGSEEEILASYCSVHADTTCEACSLCATYVDNHSCLKLSLCNGYVPWWVTDGSGRRRLAEGNDGSMADDEWTRTTVKVVTTFVCVEGPCLDMVN